MSAIDTYKEDFKRGFETEDRFIADCKALGTECYKATKKEDMKDHVDVILLKDGKEFKADIKGLKKIQRKDSSQQEDYHYVELKNVNGDIGWLYGKADLFAFETFNAWVIVFKKNLQKFVRENVSDEFVDSPTDAILKKYTRNGRNDVITRVKTLDLVYASSKIIRKTIR